MGALVIRQPAGVPQFSLTPGMIVEMSPTEKARSRFRVDRRIHKNGSSPSEIEFSEPATGAIMFLTDEQIAFMMRKGEFRVTHHSTGAAFKNRVNPLELTDDQKKECAKRREYVKACLNLPRSEAALEGRINEVWARLSEDDADEVKPSWRNVIRWIDRWTQVEHPTEADLCPDPNTGKKGSRLEGRIGAAIQHGAVEALKSPKGTGDEALQHAKIYLEEHHPDLAGVDLRPLLRTAQRRMADMNRYEADGLTFGEKSADRLHRRSYSTKRPDLPLEWVDCDHTPSDVLLCDVDRKVIFGSADIITFRCRCTGLPLGFSIGFELPSYASFLAGLSHAIYPKDLSEYPNIRNPWFGYGRFKRLGVDNALHLIGNDIRNAGAGMGFEKVEFRPGEPWLKGALEKLQGDLNRAVSHKLPAAKFSNIEERKKFKELEGRPLVTVQELRGYLTHYICDEYNVKPHEGLGFLDTLRDIPKRLWDERIDQIGLVDLPSEDEFVALAGKTDRRTINARGIRWNKIRYQSPELAILQTHPRHRAGAEDGLRRGVKYEGTRYKVMRTPWDLGHIHVINPYPEGPRVIKVPAVRQDYAAGLTLFQHRVFLRNADKKLLDALKDPVDELKRAARDVSEFTRAMFAMRSHTGVQRTLARFLEQGQRQHARSVVTTEPYSREMSRNVLDVTAPPALPPPATANPNTPHPTRAQPPKPGTEAEPILTGDGVPVPGDRGARNEDAGTDRTSAAETNPIVHLDGGDDDLDRLRQEMKDAEGWGD